MEQKDIDEMNAKFSEFVEWQKGFSKRVLWKKPNVPDENTPMGTKVRCRDAHGADWIPGRFVQFDDDDDDECQFQVLANKSVSWYVFCELEEE